MNLYQPHRMRIDEITDETPDTRTFRLTFQDPALRDAFRFSAGQFGEYSVFGEGESTFCIASPPTRKGYIECSFRGIGKVTQAMRRLGVGDTLGFRGPYGNTFPLERMKGHSVVFVAGGIALPPVRCVIWNVLDLRGDFKDVTIVYGAKTVSDLVYKRELAEWGSRPDVKLWQAVDPGGQTPDWKGEVGLIPKVLEKAAPSGEDAFAVVCGPPVMIKLSLPVLAGLGFAGCDVYTTLENRMKCGLGKCGRCNTGRSYVCKDGPVYTLAQLEALPAEY